jgi:hypothetical protein
MAWCLEVENIMSDYFSRGCCAEFEALIEQEMIKAEQKKKKP